jgi:hypothetical protein
MLKLILKIVLVIKRQHTVSLAVPVVYKDVSFLSACGIRLHTADIVPDRIIVHLHNRTQVVLETALALKFCKNLTINLVRKIVEILVLLRL